MGKHSLASDHVQQMCERLYEAVASAVKEVRRNEAGTVCSLGNPLCFAYVYHQKQRLQVYVYAGAGDEEVLRSILSGPNSLGLQSRKQTNKTKGWPAVTALFFYVTERSEINDAAKLLIHAAEARNPN
jgi:hypothetical protein